MRELSTESGKAPLSAFFADGDASSPPERGLGVRSILAVLGFGAGIGLLLGGVNFAFVRSVPGSLYWLVASCVFSLMTLVLWVWVLPLFESYSRGQRLACQWGVAVTAFSVLSLLIVEIHYSVFGLGSGSILWPYQGADLSLTITAEALRRSPWIFALIPVVPSAILCILGFNQTFRVISDLEVRQEELRELAISAQLAALRAQLNPHFLFNSLNSIAELVRTDPDRAEECIERLAEILRYVLQRTQIDLVPLSDEVRIAQSYLEIERARYGEALSVETRVDDSVRGILLPGLILQPLVENAVQHGVSQKVGGGLITIEAELRGDDLCIAVRDTGVGMDAGGSPFDRGVGLRNLRERLTRRYGPGYEPVIETDADHGTSVLVRVPSRAVS